MQKPLLLNQYEDIRAIDFDIKVPRLLFIVINNMFRNGALELTPMEVDMEMERHEAAYSIYKQNDGLEFLKDAYDFAKLDNFDYYYKRLKKLSLLRSLKNGNYDISMYYKDSFDTMREEEEAAERLEQDDIETILSNVESDLNLIRADFLGGTTGQRASADEGMRALIAGFQQKPEIGQPLSGKYYNAICRGARLGKYYLRSAASGVGKAVPHNTLIPLSSGQLILARQVRPGDQFVGKNGKPTTVLQIHPQKEKYFITRIYFESGRTAECNIDHLWTFQMLGPDGWETITQNLLFIKNKSNGYKNLPSLRVPLFEGIKGEQEEDTLRLAIKEWKRKGGTVDKTNGRLFIRNPIKGYYFKYGLNVVPTFTKNIYELRGSLEKKQAIVDECDREFVKEREGERWDTILKIEETEFPTEMICFTVDAPDHLFCMNNYIVTHNTRLAVFDACKIAYPIYFSPQKSTFIKETLDNGETRSPQKTLFITTEMGKDEIQTIIIAYLSGVNEELIRNGLCSPQEMERVMYAVQLVEQFKDYFYIEEISDPNLTNVEAKIKRFATIEQVKYVYFDYIFSSPSLVSQFAAAKLREDVVLMMLSNQLKQLAKDYNIFIASSTQVNAHGLEEGFKDESTIRGSRAIADKVDFGCVVSRISREEYESLRPKLNLAVNSHKIDRANLVCAPTHVIDIYKNRGGKLKNVRIWSYINLGTGERHDLFVTLENNNPLPDNEVLQIFSSIDEVIIPWQNNNKFVFQ